METYRLAARRNYQEYNGIKFFLESYFISFQKLKLNQISSLEELVQLNTRKYIMSLKNSFTNVSKSKVKTSVSVFLLYWQLSQGRMADIPAFIASKSFDL